MSQKKETYKVETPDMANGHLNGITYGPTLSASDCFEVGKQAYIAGKAKYTLSWMQEALQRWQREPWDGKSANRVRDVFHHRVLNNVIVIAILG